ncbi:SMC-Scp complex subunit ScpB [Tenggerimyces flavus]|uniref:SMC-Scp complex subunit ScpB n=1 Tax=Tenggerimyces flavus TaxID=1708749 RepID=A0ABV7YJY4_9ACTN|nr:SMC-Scp complex subunit ScpB [Tenggerimyces flavus]MBM7787477.1 segregation and condensation protein B [Tenggerimyces flavus]
MTTPDDERDLGLTASNHEEANALDTPAMPDDSAELSDLDESSQDDLATDEAPASSDRSEVGDTAEGESSPSDDAPVADDDASALADDSTDAIEVDDLDLDETSRGDLASEPVESIDDSDVEDAARADASADGESSPPDAGSVVEESASLSPESDSAPGDRSSASADESADSIEVDDLDLDETSPDGLADGESAESGDGSSAPVGVSGGGGAATVGEVAESIEVTGSLLGADELVAAGAGGFVDGTDATDIEEPVHLLPLRPSIEAILLVTDEPIPTVTLAQVLGRPQPEVAEELASLSKSYTDEGRGFDLREIAGGWRLYTREEYAEVVERFVLDGQQARLTQAALETLAVVAYKQPVSRTRVSAIRGVNCDGVMRTLLSRGLVQEAGTDDESGAHLYRTTSYFLERLGLDSLGDLPDLAPYLPEIEEMEAEHAHRLDAEPEPEPEPQHDHAQEPVGAEQP